MLPNAELKIQDHDDRILVEDSEKSEIPEKSAENFSSIAHYTSLMSHFDRRSTVDQEVWAHPKCDVQLDAHHLPRDDLVTAVPARHAEIRCWAESK